MTFDMGTPAPEQLVPTTARIVGSETIFLTRCLPAFCAAAIILCLKFQGVTENFTLEVHGDFDTILGVRA
jgi:hypothetical protein